MQAKAKGRYHLKYNDTYWDIRGSSFPRIFDRSCGLLLFATFAHGSHGGTLLRTSHRSLRKNKRQQLRASTFCGRMLIVHEKSEDTRRRLKTPGIRFMQGNYFLPADCLELIRIICLFVSCYLYFKPLLNQRRIRLDSKQPSSTYATRTTSGSRIYAAGPLEPLTEMWQHI